MPSVRCWVTCAGLALAACGDDDATGPGGGGAGGAGQGGDGGQTSCSSEAVPAPPPADACARMPGGPAGVRSTAVDLSAAHDLTRFFSPVATVEDADQALVLGLAGGAALVNGDLSGYAAALPGVLCARQAAAPAGLGAARVELKDGAAWVTPGTGAVSLPAEATSVVVDFRGLPDDAGLRAALEAAVAPALVGPIARPSRRVREHDGLVDEIFVAMNVYEQRVEVVDQPPIIGTGATELALGLLTDAVLAPEAAEIALALRTANRAFIVGEDVRADVAESQWQGVGAGGVYVRTRDLVFGSAAVPNVVPADRRSTAPECVVREVIAAGLPPPLAGGAADRPEIDVHETFGLVQPPGESLAEAQAALVVAHAAARRFFPYFPVVGDTIDERLDETIATLSEPLDRATIRHTLRRFGEALQDGHSFVYDRAFAGAAGYLPVMIEDVDGEPLVRRSLAVGVNAGDTIISLDGVPTADFYATELARTSAASPGYKFDIATRELLQLEGPVSLGLRDADGVTRTIDFTPQAVDDLVAVGFAPSLRPAGFLDDLGAPSLYYLNLDGDVLSSDAAFGAAMTEAQGAAGLIVDMRGYPSINHYAVASRLVTTGFSSPVFLTTRHTGPDTSTVVESSFPLSPSSPFTGPIVLLVSHHSVSAAENFSTMLVDADRVTVVGRNSAATNGNITGVNLPGAFTFSFTGMDVRHADADKTVFHGIGIRPEIETVLTPADFRDGVDPELEEAITELLSRAGGTIAPPGR